MQLAKTDAAVRRGLERRKGRKHEAALALALVPLAHTHGDCLDLGACYATTEEREGPAAPKWAPFQSWVASRKFLIFFF